MKKLFFNIFCGSLVAILIVFIFRYMPKLTGKTFSSVHFSQFKMYPEQPREFSNSFVFNRKSLILYEGYLIGGKYDFYLRARTNFPKAHPVFDLVVDGKELCKFKVTDVSNKEFHCEAEIPGGIMEIFLDYHYDQVKKIPYSTLVDFKIEYQPGTYFSKKNYLNQDRRYPQIFSKRSPQEVKKDCEKNSPQNIDSCINYISKRMMQ